MLNSGSAVRCALAVYWRIDLVLWSLVMSGELELAAAAAAFSADKT